MSSSPQAQQQQQQERIKEIVRKFVMDFSQPLDDDAARESIESVCSPNIKWRDHAFHVERQGHEAVLGLRKAFNHCNQPFDTQIKKLHHTSTGVIAELVWIGCCKNDIVRPSGEIAVKANGKDFVCHVCLMFEVDPVDGIVGIDEYYNKAWWDGVPEENYQKILGASMKS